MLEPEPVQTLSTAQPSTAASHPAPSAPSTFPSGSGPSGLGSSTVAAALIGAAAGALGVFAMDRLDWFLWRRMPTKDRIRTVAARPGGESPDQVIVTRLSDAAGTRLTPATHAAASSIVHYKLGIAPAIGYALLRHRLPGRGVARGAGYGLAMFALHDEGLNTVTGLGGRPSAYPWQDHARGAAAHILYGIVTDAALTRMQRAAQSRRLRRSAMAQAA